MGRLRNEARCFAEQKRAAAVEGAQRAAFQLAFGFDIEDALACDGTRRQRTLLRLKRVLERERQKGARRHWSYDLNRHIALKQAFDRLAARQG